MRMMHYLTSGNRYTEQMYGMELEVEYCHHPTAHMFWRVTGDGSLRNGGAEYVSPPSNKAFLDARIPEFYAMKDAGGWVSSPRTGVHLHMDSSLYTVDQFLAYLTAYAALEPVIFHALCGAHREENIYCIPWARCAMPVERLVAFFNRPRSKQTPTWFRDMCLGLPKYSAMNLAPLIKYGTTEFRGAPTYDSAEKALLLVQVFDTLLKRSTQEGSPAAIVARLEDINETAAYLLPDLDVRDADRIVLKSSSLAVADLLYPDPTPDDLAREWDMAVAEEVMNNIFDQPEEIG